MPNKYLRFFPKPVLGDLVSGRWLPVVGAGMSANAELPAGKKMPLWSGLAKQFAAELADYELHTTLDAISAYQHEFGRAKLIERLTEILLVADAQPGDAHRAFCSIPFDIVCTTNFDFLLERQYAISPRYVCPVVDEEQLSINTSPAGTLLLKLHGDLHHPKRLVVTEEDYDRFLVSQPVIATYLSNQLITKTAVLVGYSLDDPDFRQLWSIVTERLGRSRRMAYAILVGATASEIARFERRGVKVINLPGSREKYGKVLSEAFGELHEYMRDNVISVSQVTQEESLRELQLPRAASTRLCFFSIPLELLSLYRSKVFPAVEDIGLVPVTATDVISPGDNVNAKIDALVERASIVVVELSTAWTRAELDIAVAVRARSRSDRHGRATPAIVVVVDDVKKIEQAADLSVVLRRSPLTDEADQFVDDLIALLRVTTELLPIDQHLEAQRLLESGEDRAAVISSISALEAWLRRQLDKASWLDVRRPATLRQLIDRAREQGIITAPTTKDLHDWVVVRNRAVHSSKTVDHVTAAKIVAGVHQITRFT